MNNPTIVFQDDHLLVINKPAGLVVNRADSVAEPTLQDWIEKNFDYPISHDYDHRNGIVHRLDKDTSGILLLAKTIDAQNSLQSQFKSRTIKKSYTALVHGRLSPRNGFISLPLGRSTFDRKSFTVDVEGKLTKTSYEVERYYTKLSDAKLQSNSYQGFTLVSLFPQTGRTHQLRVVLKHLGHPIVGDSKYTGKKRSKADTTWCHRQFLHAAFIQFTHPISQQTLQFKAPLAKDLKNALTLLS